MVKRSVNINEEWPIFSLTDPILGQECWNIELSDEEYREYIWTMYKYTEWQIKIGLMYDKAMCGNSEANCGYGISEDSKPNRDSSFNFIRKKDHSSEKQLSAFLSESVE